MLDEKDVRRRSKARASETKSGGNDFEKVNLLEKGNA